MPVKSASPLSLEGVLTAIKIISDSPTPSLILELKDNLFSFVLRLTNSPNPGS